MADHKAAGYFKAASSAQAFQPVIARGVWNMTVQAASDKVFIGKLPAGHRVVPHLIKLFFNASTPAANVDLCVGSNTNVLIDNAAVTASTAHLTAPPDTVATHAMCETIGVDYTQDRDVYLLINSGAATAPAGAKAILTFASVPVPSDD